MAGYGWPGGFGDAITAVDKIRRALQDTEGATEQYAEAIAFLSQLEVTFKHLEKHSQESSSSYSDDIALQLKLIETPWKRLETSLEKYEKSLGANSSKSKTRRMPKKVQWGLTSINEAIGNAKADILQPLKMIDSLLALETMTSIKELNQKCQHIIDALQLTDASDSLNMSILNEHAADQKTSQKESLDQLVSLQQTITQQHQAVLYFVEEASLATAARVQDETTRSIADTTSEIASCVKSIGEQLNSTTIEGGLLKCELHNQQSSIQAVQKDLQELLEHGKRIETLEGPPKPENKNVTSSVDWSAIGKILATAASAFAFGCKSRGPYSGSPQEIGRMSLQDEDAHIKPQSPWYTTDWTCSDCGAQNLELCDLCPRCNKDIHGLSPLRWNNTDEQEGISQSVQGRKPSGSLPLDGNGTLEPDYKEPSRQSNFKQLPPSWVDEFASKSTTQSHRTPSSSARETTVPKYAGLPRFSQFSAGKVWRREAKQKPDFAELPTKSPVQSPVQSQVELPNPSNHTGIIGGGGGIGGWRRGWRGGGGSPKLGAAGGAAGCPAPGDWTCPYCVSVNSDLTPDFCPACGSMRP